MGFMGNGFRPVRSSLGVILTIWQEMAREALEKYDAMRVRLRRIPDWAGRAQIENWLGLSYRRPDPEYWYATISDLVRSGSKFDYEDNQAAEKLRYYAGQFEAKVLAAEDLAAKASPIIGDDGATVVENPDGTIIVTKPDGSVVVIPGGDGESPVAEGTGIGTIAAIGVGAALVAGGLYAALS